MSIGSLLNKINDLILNPIVYLMFAAAFLVFIWGVFVMVSGASNEEAKITGRRNMIWGIVGMVIMVSVYGIINIIMGTFGITGVPGLSN